MDKYMGDEDLADSFLKGCCFKGSNQNQTLGLVVGSWSCVHVFWYSVVQTSFQHTWPFSAHGIFLVGLFFWILKGVWSTWQF